MIKVRTGTKEDLPRVLELVKELAEYEKALSEVTNTVEMMELDAFGKEPAFGFFVAEMNDRIVGLSFNYYLYYTCNSTRLYLEDIVVTQSERGKGIGHLLFEETMRFSLVNNCSGMMWQVLDWNKPAIDFYEKYNSRFDPEWINCHLEAEQISGFLAQQSG